MAIIGHHTENDNTPIRVSVQAMQNTVPYGRIWTVMIALLIASLLTNTTQLAKAIAEERFGERFELEGLVTLTTGEHASLFPLVTPSGNTSVFKTLKPEIYPLAEDFPKAGDFIHASGILTTNRLGLLIPECTDIKLLSRAKPPRPVPVTVEDIHSGKVDCLAIKTEGTVRDIFKDEIDPNWIYVALNCNGTPLYAVMPDSGIGLAGMARFGDCKVSVKGVCHSFNDSIRRMMGKSLFVSDPGEIEIITKAPSDPFDVPLVSKGMSDLPSDLFKHGKRKLIGRVTACWGNGNVLLHDSTGNPHRITFTTQPHPEYGEMIEAVGYPETDLYRINLSSAIWRKSSASAPHEEPPTDVSATALLGDPCGNRKIDPRFHGKAIRIAGTVIDANERQNGPCIVTIRSDGFVIPVEIRAHDLPTSALEPGCQVCITGTCIVETENWKPYASFPHATGITLAVHTPDNIRIVSRPSWWTAKRLGVIVGLLSGIIIAILIWNRILQRVIDRKSRQLLKEQVAQIKTALRVDERTHLAVELHDSLSQNLSGVACQIAATKGTLPDGADESARYLATAERMLLSCRTELRRCLWDLRSDTLEDPNFAEAVRKTLTPVAISVETIIRFNVPRSRLSDTTAHAVLCIIRELVANAIRHGKAKTVRVAGEFHDGTLSFSVRDDGCGFDLSTCDGPAEGHFGLEGIRERVKHLDGTFTITAEPGKGTRAEVTLTSIMPKDDQTRT